MRVKIVYPSSRVASSGNFITATRWQSILKQLGHDVHVSSTFNNSQADQTDLLIALNARKTGDVIAQFKHRFPEKQTFVAITGTDVYGESAHAQIVEQSLTLADRIIVLNPKSTDAIAAHLRPKSVVVFQSAEAFDGEKEKSVTGFQVAVIGHLREEKNPFQIVAAVKRLEPISKIQVIHLGGALDESWERQARDFSNNCDRYRWMGERSYQETRQVIASSDLVVTTSRHEGAPAVISECIVDGIPILASSIPGHCGLLGECYPGYFEVDDVKELHRKLRLAESDPAFYERLKSRVVELQSQFRADAEFDSWQKLMSAVAGQ